MKQFSSKNFKWAHPEEIEAANEQDRIDAIEDAAEREKHLACAWNAKSGQWIEIFVYDDGCITVYVNQQSYEYCEITPLSAQQQQKYPGIVAKCGPVGISSEQKAAIEAKMGR